MSKSTHDDTGIAELKFVGTHHQGILLSLSVKSLFHCGSDNPTLAANTKKSRSSTSNQENNQQLMAIVGDLVRSISLVQYYPKFQTIEELARDFNSNFTTAIEMLTPNIYLGAETWNNIFTLKYNANASAEEIKCRLDTVGEFHLGEMVNKFMPGTLNMTTATSTANIHNSQTSMGNTSSQGSTNSASGGGGNSRLDNIQIGSQTLFGTVDGSIGSILGLDRSSFAFFSALETSMAKIVRPVGDFSHDEFRAFQAEKRLHPSRGFIDGDFIESFLDLDSSTMQAIVQDMNEHAATTDLMMMDERTTTVDDFLDDKATSGDDESKNNKHTLTVNDVLAMVEEMTMLH